MRTSRIFPILILMLVCSLLQAQTQQGSFMVGGNAGFASSKSGDSKATVVSLVPQIGYFVIDKLAVGASIGFTLLNFDGDLLDATVIGAGPFVRYYFTDASNIRPFGQVGIDWSNTKPKRGDSTSSFGYNAGVGVSFFLNEHVAIDGILGYNSNKQKNAENSVNTFGLTFGVQAFFGG